MITLQMQLRFFILTYYPSAGYSVDVCSASVSCELNVKTESQGGLYASQAARSYFRFLLQLHPLLIVSQHGLCMSPCSG